MYLDGPECSYVARREKYTARLLAQIALGEHLSYRKPLHSDHSVLTPITDCDFGYLVPKEVINKNFQPLASLPTRQRGILIRGSPEAGQDGLS